MPLLFVDGLLKQGFPHFHVDKGQRVPVDVATYTAEHAQSLRW
ncbi:MAG: hypothetical protein WAQ05_11685 [Rubrivivax sp.]